MSGLRDVLRQVYGDSHDLPNETDLSDVQDSLDALVESAEVTDDDRENGDDTPDVAEPPHNWNGPDAQSALDQLSEWVATPNAESSDEPQDSGSDEVVPVSTVSEGSDTSPHARTDWLDELDSDTSMGWIDDLEDSTEVDSDLAETDTDLESVVEPAAEVLDGIQESKIAADTTPVTEKPSPTTNEIFDGRENDEQWLDDLFAVDGVQFDRTASPKPVEPQKPSGGQPAISPTQDLGAGVTVPVPIGATITGDWLRSDDDILPAKGPKMRRRSNTGLASAADGDGPIAPPPVIHDVGMPAAPESPDARGG